MEGGRGKKLLHCITDLFSPNSDIYRRAQLTAVKRGLLGVNAINRPHFVSISRKWSELRAQAST